MLVNTMAALSDGLDQVRALLAIEGGGLALPTRGKYVSRETVKRLESEGLIYSSQYGWMLTGKGRRAMEDYEWCAVRRTRATEPGE